MDTNAFDFFAEKNASSDAQDKCASFLQLLKNNFEAACDGKGTIQRSFQIGTKIISLNFAGDSLLQTTTAALEHLEIDHSEKIHSETCDSIDSSTAIYCWDSVSTGVKMPPPPWRWEDFTRRGDIKGYYNKRYSISYLCHYNALYAFDRFTNQGFFWTYDSNKLPFYFKSAPIRPLLHWFCCSQDLHLFHAAAVAKNDQGILIAGKGGSGKSTSSLLCLNAGFEFLGDDYVAVGLSPQPIIYNLYNTAKVERTERVDIDDISLKMGYLDNTPLNEKAAVFFDAKKNARLKKQAALKAILIGKITSEKKTNICEVSAAQAAMALIPTTMAQTSGIYEDILFYVARLTKKVPCYKICFGSDVSKIPTVIGEFIENLSY